MRKHSVRGNVMKAVALGILAVGAMLFIAPGSALAEDIDLYANNNGIVGDVPNREAAV